MYSVSPSQFLGPPKVNGFVFLHDMNNMKKNTNVNLLKKDKDSSRNAWGWHRVSWIVSIVILMPRKCSGKHTDCSFLFAFAAVCLRKCREAREVDKPK